MSSAISGYLAFVRERIERSPGVRRTADSRWLDVDADAVGEALMQAWAINGLDLMFFCTGTDIVWIQECAVKLRELGRPTPRLLTMLHEFAALSAASGYSMVSRRPSMTAAHVDAGTLNYGGAIHNAAHGGYPVLITSGKTPAALGGTAPGDRDASNMWLQDLTDHGQILRQYVKWDHDLRATDNPGVVVSRALQVAMTEPWGPAYLSIARDVAMTPIQGARFPAVTDLGIPEPPAADQDAIRQVARWLVDAENPLVISQHLGRDPRAVAPMVALAELLALPFAEVRRDRMNFPSRHPLYDGGPRVQDADVVLVVEAMVPWQPGYAEPSPGAKIVHLGLDPVASRHLYYEFSADLRIAAEPAAALQQLYAEAERLLTAHHRQNIAERRERIAATSGASHQRAEQIALSGADATRITPEYLSYVLGQVLPEDALLLDESVSNMHHVVRYTNTSEPGTFFRSGATAGGWGPAAAFGAKLAAPDRFVALTIGDGFFLYGVPYAGLWAAVKYGAPYLTVVYQNHAYTTGTTSVAHYYPDGFAAREGTYEGGVIEPAPDLAKLAESAGAYGENVSEPAQLRAALERGIQQVRQGTPAVIAVHLPQP